MKVCDAAMPKYFAVCGDITDSRDEVQHVCTLPEGHLAVGEAHACECGVCWSNLGESRGDES